MRSPSWPSRGSSRPVPGKGTFAAARRATVEGDLDWQLVAVPQGGASDRLVRLLSPPAPGTIPLAVGYLDDSLQPVGLLAQAASRAARRPGSWSRLPPEGLEPLRTWFATAIGGPQRAADVLVVAGGQAGLATAFRALAAPGDAVVMEAPTYVGATAAARSAGLRAFPVPADEGGLRPALLREALHRSGARLVYCQPLYANPHGTVLAEERRPAVLEAVADAGAFLVEDDWARDLVLDGPAPRPLAADDRDGHVVYVRSLTKIAAPGLRVAALVARGPAFARLRSARLVDDLHGSGVLHETALSLVSAPSFARHVRRVQAELRIRRDVLLSELAARCPQLHVRHVPRGGLHLWADLPPGSDDEQIAADALRAGVLVGAGTPYYPAEAARPGLRLSFAGAGADDLRDGVRRLAAVLEQP